MKKIIIALLLSVISLQLSNAQIGTWRNYLAYHDIQQIQAAGNDLFVLASNSLYQYNKNDQSIYTYDKVNGLSDVTISNIKWCQQAKRLVVIYDNSNIDLVETNGTITNISDLYSRSIIGGKNIHSITIKDQYAYLSCDFGVVKMDVKRAEISETYMLGFVINATAFEGSNIYVKSNEKGIWTAPLTSNLIDPGNWSQTTIAPSFEQDNSDYTDNIDLVKTLKPGGPDYNYFYESKFSNGKLFTTGGGFLSGLLETGYIGTIQVYDGTSWTVYPNDISQTTGFTYIDINCIDVDPTNENHVFAGGRSGLYEFLNGKLKAFYYKENSPLKPVTTSAGVEFDNHYTLVHGIKFDGNGNLWVLNSQRPNGNLFLLTKEGEWKSFSKNELNKSASENSLPGLRRITVDSRGLMWFVNSNYEKPAVFSYDIVNDQICTYNSFTNEDGISYTNYMVPYDIAEDKNGDMWVTTTSGPFIIRKQEIGQSTATFYQEKIPRNDGTDYADYLLSGIVTKCIAIDGGGRKWIGTENMGVFLISTDNTTQVQHFTAENSKLLSNHVFNININNETGEVFFLTNKGLCSYISDATTPAAEMTKDNVWAYPNPVNPDYSGPITVTGLSYDADVKIVASNGALITEGRSNGGTFQWDGCNKNGDRVASGIYMVVTATSTGEKGTVCKIAIVR